MKRTLLSTLLILMLMAAACTPGQIFQERKSLSPKMVWNMDNVLGYKVDVADASCGYDIIIDIRTVDFYQFSNMWLYIKTISPSGAALVDTVEYRLRDDKGFSNSTSMRFGELEDYEFMFKENVRFAESGTYTFMLQHGMRTEDLLFVNEVGLTVRKHKD